MASRQRDPLAHPLLRTVKRRVLSLGFRSSADLWERHYARGGDSGLGSRGRLAAFKAEVVNQLVTELRSTSVIEFGCGDGEQLSHYSVPTYIGLDASPTAVSRAARRFESDVTKSFFLYRPDAFADRARRLLSDLALSIDVLFHVVADEDFLLYLDHLFTCAARHVLIYACDMERPSAHPGIRYRSFTPMIAEIYPDWTLLRHIPNRYSWNGDARTSSHSEFFLYGHKGKTQQQEHCSP